MVYDKDRDLQVIDKGKIKQSKKWNKVKQK